MNEQKISIRQRMDELKKLFNLVNDKIVFLQNECFHTRKKHGICRVKDLE